MPNNTNILKTQTMKQMLAENIYLLMKSDEQIGKHCLTPKGTLACCCFGGFRLQRKNTKVCTVLLSEMKRGGENIETPNSKVTVQNIHSACPYQQISICASNTKIISNTNIRMCDKYKKTFQIQIQIFICATNKKFLYKYKYSSVLQIQKIFQ